MSIFEYLGTPGNRRKDLFYHVCIPLRIAIAIAVFIASFWGNAVVRKVAGFLMALAALTMFVMRVIDNKENIWWNRIAHGVVYGVAAAFAFLSNENRNYSYGTFILFGDVLFGLWTSQLHKWVSFVQPNLMELN